MDFDNFKAPYLPYERIRTVADSFLSRHHSAGGLPVDIEYIVEGKMGIDIIPIPLKTPFNIEALTSKDQSEIRIDLHTLENYEYRYRFSLAHEIGHIKMHEDIFEGINYQSVDDFKNAQNQFPSNEYGWLERHADNFAGLILVPDGDLEHEVAKATEKLTNEGFEITDEFHDLACEYIASDLDSTFMASAQAIKIRMEKNDIDLRNYI